MILALAVLMTLYFLSALFLVWWTVTLTRRQRNADLRRHRDILRAQITTELLLHESRVLAYLTRAR